MVCNIANHGDYYTLNERNVNKFLPFRIYEFAISSKNAAWHMSVSVWLCGLGHQHARFLPANSARAAVISLLLNRFVSRYKRNACVRSMTFIGIP